MCLDDAFLYEARKRSYVSIQALKILLENDVFGSKELDKCKILSRLDELEEEKESLRQKRVLHLGIFGEMEFQYR